jgi:integrase
MTDKLAEFLGEYRLECEQLCHQLGKTATIDDLVFSNIEGKPLAPSFLNHTFAKIVRKAGLKGVLFHDLRHSFASLMLLNGVAPKAISEALGHSSVAFTMDVYSHILPDVQKEAMTLVDEVLPADVNGVGKV